MQPILHQINVYPVKSASGIALSQAWVESIGLSFDRRFMVAEENGQFVTGRTHPLMAEIGVSLQAHGITLVHPTMSPLVLNYAHFTLEEVSTNVFDDKFTAFSTTSTANMWFSYLLGGKKQLLFMGDTSSPRVAATIKSKVSFADGFPLLLISQSSLDILNERSPDCHQMAQFRTNLVVTGCDGFEEDTWAKIRIGTAYFKVDRPCSRCVFTTLDLTTGHFRNNGEPLTTLSQFRTDSDGNVNFGMNLITISEGFIKEGDEIDVVEYRKAETYHDKGRLINSPKEKSSVSLTDEQVKTVSITIDEAHIRGDNQRSLLLQAEEAGISLDYSCRVGLCGRCKLRVVQGDVMQPDRPALLANEKEQGWVLACCCVPKSDVVLTKNE